MTTSRLLVIALTTCLSTTTTYAQSSGTGPVPRVLPEPSITSPRFAGSAQSLIALANGTLLINDVRNHRVMLSDSLLRVTSVAIDSGDYGSRSASLLCILAIRCCSSKPTPRQ